MLCYCEKCGNICVAFESELLKDHCFACDHFPLKPIPNEYIDNFRWRDGDGKQAFIEEVIKASPILDPYFFEHKDEIINEKNDMLRTATEQGKVILEGRNHSVTCSYCGSDNIKKISGTRRFFSTGILGLNSKTIGKMWHCNNCGSDF